MPYDTLVLTPRSARSTRRLFTSYTGPLVRLRRAGVDDAEMDFGYDENGLIDVLAISAWLGAGPPRVVVWYAQTGNGRDMTQSTLSRQPELDLVNYWVIFSGTTVLGRADTWSYPTSVTTAANFTDKSTNRVYFGASGGAGWAFGWLVAAQGWVATDATGGSGVRTNRANTLDAVNGSEHFCENRWPGQNDCQTLVNGTVVGATSGSTSGPTTATLKQCGGWNTALFHAGMIAEQFEFDADLAAGGNEADRNLLGNNSEFFGTSYTDV